MPKKTTPTIVWFRDDLRLADNPALAAAADSGGPIIPVYILEDAAAGPWTLGGAARWWLHQSLESLAAALEKKRVRLILRRGSAGPILEALAAETGADRVVWNRRYAPWAIAQDTGIKTDLQTRGLRVESFNGALLFEPHEIQTGAGTPYKVFTPFWRACRKKGLPTAPYAAPGLMHSPARWPASDALGSWKLQPRRPDWAGGLRETWTPGEKAAAERLEHFLDTALPAYAANRDRPDLSATSGLSPHLRFGEIGPRTLWWHLDSRETHGRAADPEDGGEALVSSRHGDAIAKFRAEIGWREFAYHLLFHFPTLPEAPLRPAFAEFPWRPDADRLRAWQRGRTGYPLVDAGMRELWHTGWMHNRVRMVSASFLVKHLLQPWPAGAAWFWDTLVDADLASNSASWQWVAGCGTDAAPYHRIFNPVMQGEKFDPKGTYVRRWVPELAALPDKYLRAPWTAPAGVLTDAGVRLGETYPAPMVDHKAARTRALAAAAALKRG